MYVPNQVGSTVVTVPSCSDGDPYNEAVTGCDSPANYSCGVVNANQVDLRINPANETSSGVQCLIHQSDANDVIQSTGQDYLNFGGNAFTQPSSYPFQILAGSSNPLLGSGVTATTPISSSTSIVSLPIYDDTTASINTNSVSNVTFIGFLQVFINAVDNKGNISVTVLNVSGCGNGSGTVGNPVGGTSPVPVRLITPP